VLDAGAVAFACQAQELGLELLAYLLLGNASLVLGVIPAGIDGLLFLFD